MESSEINLQVILVWKSKRNSIWIFPGGWISHDGKGFQYVFQYVFAKTKLP